MDVKCYLCHIKAPLEEHTDPVPLFMSSCFYAPKGWQRGYCPGQYRVDFCCQEHRDYMAEAMEIGPPAIRLLFKIFRSTTKLQQTQ